MGNGLMFAVPIICAIILIRLLTFMITNEVNSEQLETLGCGDPGTMTPADYASNCANTQTGVIGFLRSLVIGEIVGAPWQIDVPYVVLGNVVLTVTIVEAARKFAPTLPGG